jgi:hypothetical protein
MKKVYLLISSLFISSALLAQEVKNVGIGTTVPDRSAVLDIQSSDKGLLIPRLTQEQMNTIANPATGLLVFKNESANSGFFYFNGEKWTPLTNGDANAIATMDVNGWSLTGNAVAVAGVKAAATVSSFIGTPNNIPIVFKVGETRVGRLSSSSNLFLGASAGQSDGSGSNNIGIGLNSLSQYTTGNYNVGVGAATLRSLIDGVYNFAMGSNALRDVVSGQHNIGVGGNALRGLIDGNQNLAVGTNALMENLNGSFNVAIGINSGYKATGSSNVFIGRASGYNEVSSNKLYIANSGTITPLIYGDFSAKFISIGDVPLAKRDAVASSGSYSLIVEKGILSEKLKVALKSTADWADYVFEEDYKENMMSLEEVEAFTSENKHLPNVPSAAELVEKGLDFNETSRMFMEKIEELTLYMIELNKEVKALKAENESLKSKLQDK